MKRHKGREVQRHRGREVEGTNLLERKMDKARDSCKHNQIKGGAG